MATVPPRIADFLDRPRLTERYQPLDKRLGILRAPCGFGKTVLLNDICLRERDRGTLVAWLRLDGNITGDLFPNYLALAFERGGLDLSVMREPWADERCTRKTSHRVGLLMRAIESHGKPCLLALDEVERLDCREAVSVLDMLVRRGPPNLHLAMAMRSSPQGFDVATTLLDRRCTVFNVDDLRFTNPEIALFLGRALSREELIEAVAHTEGWPVALRTYRDLKCNGRDRSAPAELSEYRAMVEEFLSARLMRDLTPDSREFMLDFGLFETIAPSLVDDIFPDEHIKCRTELLAKLRGLFGPVDRNGSALRLHPVIREYCRARRLREDTGRVQQFHRRLAIAMARRGDLNEAVRHATAAGDDALFGEILEVGCGAGLLFGVGVEPFLSAVERLNPDMAENIPRLALMRCIGLLLNGDTRAARALFERTETSTQDHRRNREDSADPALRADGLIVRSMLLAYACRPLGDANVGRLLEEIASLVADDSLAPVLRGSLCTALCIRDHQQARFGASRQWRTRAKQFFHLANSAHGSSLVDLQRGLVAVAQGRVQDALAAYTRAGSITVAGLLRSELQIERNRTGSRWTLELVDVGLENLSGWLDIHAAAHGNRAEQAFDSGGPEAAVDVLEYSLDLAVRRNLGGLVRILSAQRASCLAEVGHLDAARRAWNKAELPTHLAGLLELDRQTWREMEAVSCARIVLLRASGDFADARRLAQLLRDTASSWGLTRTLMRCLAEWMVLEFRALDTAAAVARLHDFLMRFRTTDYSRPLARHADVSARVLNCLLDTETASDIRGHAESLLHDFSKPEVDGKFDESRFSAQELKVLQGLSLGQRDKEVARCVGLTENGVRYHLKNIYRKMGVSRRGEAVQRARSVGVV